MGITPSHDLNLPQSTAYQTHFKQLNLKSIIMSDAARKGFGEQAQEKLTPQSQKSTGQVIGENLTGAGDKFAAAVQPSSEKSTTQKLVTASEAPATVLKRRVVVCSTVSPRPSLIPSTPSLARPRTPP